MPNMHDHDEQQSNESDIMSRRVIGYVLAVCFALGAFLSGLQVGQGMQGEGQMAGLMSLFAASPEETADRPELEQFWDVWDLLDEKFASASSSSPVSNESRVRGAIQGLVEAYDDPYTVYLPPKESNAFNEDISGNFSGVGMEVGMREGLITVIAPLPETPAENAGILAGDVIVAIDGESTERMSIDDAVQLIRGEKGTAVQLRIFREGDTEFREIQIVRDNIEIPTVETEQVDNTFIVQIYSFNAVAEQQVREAMREYLTSGADSLVIDVRGNPGGYMQSAVGIASYFLPAGKVVVTEEFSDDTKDEVFRSRGRAIAEFNPDNLVVLIDNGSASASEILAGALKDHGVATIIGSQSFGKGSVQQLIELDDGSSLKVTVARWLTPNGVSISDNGLEPDIVIGRSPAERMAGEDPQKDAAVRFLDGETVESEEVAEELSASSTETGE